VCKLDFSYCAYCPRCGKFIFSVPSFRDLRGMVMYCPHYPRPYERCGGCFNGNEEYERITKGLDTERKKGVN
jgi:hypothetical protein